MNEDMLALVLETADRAFTRACPPDRHHAGDADTAAIWREIAASGLPDLLVAEADGGSGLPLAALGEVAMLAGRHLLPVPLADTIAARWLTQGLGDAAVVLVAAGPHPWALPFAGAAQQLLVERDGTLLIGAARPALRAAGDGLVIVPANFEGRLVGTSPGLLPIIASLRAAEMAGMLGRLLDMTVTHANDRSQFGQPIAGFQAVQQQVSVLAEEAVAAAMAVRLAFADNHVSPLAAGIAKLRAGSAAEKGLAIAHAVTGAIGITADHPLHAYARRLIDCRLAGGSDNHWAMMVGRARLSSATQGSVAFLQTRR